MGTAYTLADVARICKISPRRLRYWERTALVSSSAPRAGDPRSYGFRDLVAFRSVRDWVDQGVSVRRIRRCVETVRLRMPDVERPVDALRLWMEGSERMVVRHGDVLVEPDGQTVLDFSPPPDRENGVASLAPRHTSPHPPEPHETALAWFEQGCALDGDPESYGAAVEAYRSAVEADPGFADAHCNLGSVYFNQNRRVEARECFERALEIDPRHPEANLNAATLFEEEGRLELALRHYRAALESRPWCADAHVSLALLYERLGLPRRSTSHWRSYLSLDPQGVWADLARQRLDRGRV